MRPAAICKRPRPPPRPPRQSRRRPPPPARRPTPPAPTPGATTTTASPAAPVHAAKKVTKTDRTARWPQHRPPAFTVAGARAEPLNEMPLPDRAQALRSWLDAHRKKTRANVAHWLYQNEWIVAGAKLGWWRGAAALATLVAVDRRTQQLWGVGAQSAEVAQRALGEVQSRSK